MINVLWFSFVVAGLLVAAFTGKIDSITGIIFSYSEKAVSISIGLISIMTFWLGVMRIIEKSELINYIKKILRPVACFLFPDIPRDHAAMNAILMNMSASLLGLGNAATPFGLKAMQELKNIEKSSVKATDEMCTFLALNTSSLTIVPTTVIGLRAAAGSLNPTEIVGTTIIATACSTLAALFFDRLLRKYYT